MIKLNKIIVLAAALLCSAIGFTGCPSSTPPATNNTNTVVNNTNKPANTTAPANTSGPANSTSTSNSGTSSTTTGDKIGVAECDEYIEKVEACIMGKVPEAQRATFKSSFDTMRKQWKDAAANPQTKSGLATGCKAALDSAKQTYGAYGCTF